MHPLLRFLVSLLALTVATAAGAQSINPGCTHSGNHFDCPLLVGVNNYEAVFDPSQGYLVDNIRIHNNSGNWRYLVSVTANASDRSAWGEFSVYLNQFATRQDVPGIGVVGARDWFPFLKHIPGIPFDPGLQGRGLAVAPGSTVYLHNNAHAMLNGGIEYATITYGVSFVANAVGLRSFRQPPVDTVHTCNGTNQWSPWSPWLNNTAQPWITDTVHLYTKAQNHHHVDAACLYILNGAEQVRWTYCSGVNTRGVVRFPQQSVQPGESLVGQARHRCTPPGVWDWAAWFYVR